MKAGFLAPIVGLCVVACASAPARHYYTLTYPPPTPRFDVPHPITVRVKDLEVRETYRGSELVFRPDVHEIRYFKHRRWSERPGKMMTNLLRDHLRRAGVARQVTEEIGQTPPDYTLVGEVEAIEELQVGEDRYARLAMSLSLVRFEDDAVVWRWRIDERRPTGGRSVLGTVRTLSDLLSTQTSRAIDDLGRWLADPTAPRAEEVEAPPEAGPPAPAEETVVGPDPDSPLNDHPQLQQDETPVPVGFGSVFLPALSSGDREPLVVAYRDGRAVAEGRMGERVVLEPGEYEVRLGSGALDQRVRVRARVEDGRATVVPPSWAGLDVHVVDHRFVPFRGIYELIRMDTRDVLGVGLGADELIGERTKVWVLKPGLYKIVRSGGTYRDRTSFATVRLEGGRLTRFTLVMHEETGEFLGAGEDALLLGEAEEDEAWQFSAVLGGDPKLSWSEEEEMPEEGWTVGGEVFFDGRASFEQGPHRWETRLDLEEAQELLPGEKYLRNTNDRAYLHTFYTYRLLPWFGPYARAGVVTNLLPINAKVPGGTTIVEELDEEGRVIRQHRLDPEDPRVSLGGPFRDTNFEQGMGGNFQVLHTSALELDVRAGLGARQYFANGKLNYIGDRDVLDPAVDDLSVGPEGGFVGQARLFRWVTVTSDFTGLFPFDDLAGGAIINWRNTTSLRLLSFVSLVHRLSYRRDRARDRDDPEKWTHDIQLRFSYELL